ncbi:DUF6816 family protein [Coleofasciculus sp. G1-WW12-02]|uniref:DUF6816 family protein n=1 Tax=Coleofasciculus sp. G1-WW12-02 TaxID=3068483 RepID=UPI0040627C62
MAILPRLIGLGLILVYCFWTNPAQAGQLADRVAQFPNWQTKPPVMAATGDLVYPDWMEGTWNVTSTLVEQIAPLAPEVITPGMKSNRRYLNQPMQFRVRFERVDQVQSKSRDRIIPLPRQRESGVVADREFNGLNIAQAYLGDGAIRSVKVDPASVNRQITELRSGRQIISIVTDRNTETPSRDRFIATEVTNQYFRGTNQPYLNQVETTTAYHQLPSPDSGIEAWQITAIYLSPQDPDYFKALDKPVALYRYRLQLEPIQ